jgi:S-adenosylmethionine/arginine decarboxylase-like enzyme
MKPYGKELILDLHDCNPSTFTRDSLEKYFKALCTLINMQRCDLHFWDYEGEPEEYDKAPKHLKGVSAIQFITTSNIIIHTLDDLKKVFINIFTCKDFVVKDAIFISEKWFKGKVAHYRMVDRI